MANSKDMECSSQILTHTKEISATESITGKEDTLGVQATPMKAAISSARRADLGCTGTLMGLDTRGRG